MNIVGFLIDGRIYWTLTQLVAAGYCALLHTKQTHAGVGSHFLTRCSTVVASNGGCSFLWVTELSVTSDISF